jgi:predicted CXXCH cytochrome family protein
MLADSQGAVCNSCHDMSEQIGAAAVSMHAPAASGQCTNCHQPHHTAEASLLVDRADRICLTCHTDLKERMAQGRVHEPAGEGECLGCHDPHGGGFESLLVDAPTAVCLGCHDGSDSDFKTKHLGLSGEQIDCRMCHDPHAGTEQGLLHPRQHEPFLSGDCSICHESAPDKEGE